MRLRLTALIGICGFAQFASGVTHVYDDANRLTQTIREDGAATLFVYDDANNLLAVTNINVPSAPQNFSATLGSTTSATLVWEDTSNSETGYYVERRNARNYEWALIAALPANSTTYTDSPLDPNETYVYRVYAVGAPQGDTAIMSAYSVEAAAAGAASEVFTIRSFQKIGDRLELSFTAEAGTTYSLQSSLTLQEESWALATFSLTPSGDSNSSNLSGVSGPVVIYVDMPEGSQQFYRLLRQ
ncbi:fibronectin type III domain-containing protein [Cerasicoccus fimbriatus]|uniref:fibronectin type III domain-containing protein n=1 Tax=Cerasicoccus fimbriatus TaxID=3014554 RepID=UPI0022B5CC7D|nr:fibronectin type III domain-containing protein [Cerasicoccus sp. TK19100]